MQETDIPTAHTTKASVVKRINRTLRAEIYKISGGYGSLNLILM